MKDKTEFSNDSADDLIEAIQMVNQLLQNEERPTSGVHLKTLYAALITVHAAVPKRLWVRQAWIQLLGHALQDWERAIASSTATSTLDLNRLIAQMDRRSLSLEILQNSINIAYLGSTARRIDDRLLTMLSSLLRCVPAGMHFRSGDAQRVLQGTIRERILRRSGCYHAGDPNRDELVAILFFQRYLGLTEEEARQHICKDLF